MTKWWNVWWILLDETRPQQVFFRNAGIFEFYNVSSKIMKYFNAGIDSVTVWVLQLEIW